MDISPAIDRVMQGGTPARDLKQMDLPECEQFAEELRALIGKYQLALDVAGNWKRRFEALEASATPPLSHKGVKYRRGMWWHGDVAYGSAASLVTFVPEFTDADHKHLLALRDEAENVVTVEAVVGQWIREQWPAYAGAAVDEATAEIASRLYAKVPHIAQPREVPERIKQALVTLSQAWEVLVQHAPHMDGAFDNAHHDVVRYIARTVVPPRALTAQEHIDALVKQGAIERRVNINSGLGGTWTTIQAEYRNALILPEAAK